MKYILLFCNLNVSQINKLDIDFFFEKQNNNLFLSKNIHLHIYIYTFTYLHIYIYILYSAYQLALDVFQLHLSYH